MRPFLILSLLLLAAGCNQMDPFTRTGMWQQTGANDRNIAAQAVNPADLVRGHGAAGADSPLASAAVARLWENKVKPLPAASSESNSVAPTAGGNGGTSAGGP
jgi:hypothetical protein